MMNTPNNYNNNLSYTQKAKLDAKHESKYASCNQEVNVNPTEEEIKILNTTMDSMFTFAS